MIHVLYCRARVAKTCQHGEPVAYSYEDPESLSNDGTYLEGTVICDSCYVELMPLTESKRGLTHELQGAISKARSLRAAATQRALPSANLEGTP